MRDAFQFLISVDLIKRLSGLEISLKDNLNAVLDELKIFTKDKFALYQQNKQTKERRKQKGLLA